MGTDKLLNEQLNVLGGERSAARLGGEQSAHLFGRERARAVGVEHPKGTGEAGTRRCGLNWSCLDGHGHGLTWHK